MIDGSLSSEGQIYIVREVDFGYILAIHNGKVNDRKNAAEIFVDVLCSIDGSDV
jgi:hypothetical protein